MKHLTVQSVGPTPAIENIHAVAVYHKKDGRVCHLHHVITFAGAERRPQQVHERNARAYAEKLGHDPTNLEYLHVPNFQPFARKYRVDLKRKVLVEERAPEINKKKIKKKKIKKK
jgi:hypothetical protein